MKLWVVAAIGVIAVFLVFAVVLSSGSDSSSPTATADVARLSSTPTPTLTAAVYCGDKTCVPTAPTPTAPASCGFGSGEWEQCAKTAIDPAFHDYLRRFPQDTSGPDSFELAVFIEERVDWPDSCLGVDTRGVLCLQVITPGFRFVITAAPAQPYAEYHTDLNGNAVFVAEYATYATYQDVPPTHTPH